MIAQPTSCQNPMRSPKTSHEASMTVTKTMALVVNAADRVDLRRIVIHTPNAPM